MSAPLRLWRWHQRDREDFGRLTAALDQVRRVAAKGRGDYVVSLPTGPEEPDDADRARALLAQRRARDAAAGPSADMFGEPAWDVLLSLFIGFEEGRGVRTDMLATEINVRPQVLGRWIDLLVARGLVRRVADTGMVSLTDNGTALVLRCVSEI